MIGMISPLVKGLESEGFVRIRSIRWMNVIAIFGTGSLISSALVGATLGMVGGATKGLWTHAEVLLIGLIAILIASELSGSRLIGSLNRRQTPKSWAFRFGQPRAAFLWGVDLGNGFTTYASFSSYWGLVAICFLLADPVDSLFVMSGFGIGIALMVLSAPLLSWTGSLTDFIDFQVRNVAAWRVVHAGGLAVLGTVYLMV